MREAPGGAIRWRLHIPRPPEEVYRAIDSDDGRAAFWAEEARERDGTIRFRFANGVLHDSRILERRPPGVFALEYFGGAARFTLEPDGAGGTELTLTHENVAPEDWIETRAGWLNVLFPLKAWLVGSVDLRNHDPARTWDDSYADG